jgi:hypothetical protein
VVGPRWCLVYEAGVHTGTRGGSMIPETYWSLFPSEEQAEYPPAVSPGICGEVSIILLSETF